MTDIAIRIENLSKSYKNDMVIHPMSISFKSGMIYGITGPNGSGKTMLLRLIAGLVIPTTGQVKIESGKEIGIIIEHPGFLPELNGFKNLKLLAMIKNKITDDEIKKALSDVGLSADNPLPVKKYSLGMRQRLAIAQAIMENQNILLLDEPLNGIDTRGIEEIGNLLLKKKQQGATILITTHRADEINRFCDQVYEMNNGHLKLANFCKENDKGLGQK
jgi:ABC-2 type transport system ATP-binding protein